MFDAHIWTYLEPNVLLNKHLKLLKLPTSLAPFLFQWETKVFYIPLFQSVENMILCKFGKYWKEIDALGRNWGNRWCSDIDGTFMHRILNQSPPLHPHWSPCPFMQILSKLWRIKKYIAPKKFSDTKLRERYSETGMSQTCISRAVFIYLDSCFYIKLWKHHSHVKLSSSQVHNLQKICISTYIWPICLMYWSIDIRHKRRECDMFHKTAAGTNYHFLQFHVGSYRNIDCKKCATYMNHIVTAGLNWLTY